MVEQKNQRERIILIALIFILFFIGYGVGFSNGVYKTLDWGVKTASNFITIEFNEDMIAQGIFQYQNNIDNCFFKNASLLDN